MSGDEELRLYSVSDRDKRPLLDFIHGALRASGARVLWSSDASQAPFRISFETATGERAGIIAYAFLANSTLTRNRPTDEHRFQVKYGKKDGRLHRLYQDPFGLYVTLFLGIDPVSGFFVGADPVLHNPTRFFISIEFKREHADEILKNGWHVWERDRRSGSADDGPVEILVGGTPESFLRYVQFEREALGEDQGHRQLLAEREGGLTQALSETKLHVLARELDLGETEILDLITSAPRLRMAVRGWAAEEHLVKTLSQVPGVSDCRRIEEEGGPDVALSFLGSQTLTVECKNVLRKRAASGRARLDFQRTRASIEDKCSRYYKPSDFDMVAACLHSVEQRWVFKYVSTSALDPHPRCPGRLSQLVQLDDRWLASVERALGEAAERKRHYAQ